MKLKGNQTEKKSDHRLIQAKVTPAMLEAVDAAAAAEDLDRSKFVRKALRKALSQK